MKCLIIFQYILIINYSIYITNNSDNLTQITATLFNEFNVNPDTQKTSLYKIKINDLIIHDEKKTLYIKNNIDKSYNNLPIIKFSEQDKENYNKSKILSQHIIQNKPLTKKIPYSIISYLFFILYFINLILLFSVEIKKITSITLDEKYLLLINIIYLIMVNIIFFLLKSMDNFLKIFFLSNGLFFGLNIYCFIIHILCYFFNNIIFKSIVCLFTLLLLFGTFNNNMDIGKVYYLNKYEKYISMDDCFNYLKSNTILSLAINDSMAGEKIGEDLLFISIDDYENIINNIIQLK